MPTSFIEWLPPEILTEVTRLAACTKGGLPTAALNFTSCSRYLHDNLAPSSIFRRTVPLFDSKGIVQKASLTNPGLWASIFLGNFSSSAVRRRSFNPSLAGWSLQLISHCRTLQFLREMQHSDYDFSIHDDIVHEEYLPSIHVMLLSCDGKNICQLEWAGAYRYCLQWLRQYLYPADSRSEWPRDDRFVAYALSNLWLLTTADHIHQEPRVEAIQLQDMLFRFCFCPWKYPTSYAPLHRYRLPLGHSLSDTSTGVYQHHDSVVGTTMSYPLYRSYTASAARLNTSHDKVDYYGTILSISPPLISINAKKLYFCRQERFPLEIPPTASLTRAEFLARRRKEVDEMTAENPALLALYQLVQANSLGEVRHWAQTGQLPPHVATMKGLERALDDIGHITSIWGDDPILAVEPLIPDLAEWNSRRETQLPFRGGWNEEGDDIHNRRWHKIARPSASDFPSRLHALQDFGLPYVPRHLSEIHDSLFWRLRLCGDPFDHNTDLSSMLSPFDRRLLLHAGLGNAMTQLRPGRTWRPGLMKGAFQGRFGWPDEKRFLNGYRSGSLNTVALGEDITWDHRATFFQFFGRFEEHHLVQKPSCRPLCDARLERDAVTLKAVPPTLDSRSVPRHRLEPGEEPPMIHPHAPSIGPDDDLLVDEGAMNAFLPSGFRYRRSADGEGSTTTFAWGPKGKPPRDRVAEYETFDPRQPSSHDFKHCDGCKQQRAYLDAVGTLNLDTPTQELVDCLFESIGLRRSQAPSSGDSNNSVLPARDDPVEADDSLAEICQHLFEDPISTLEDVRSHSPLHAESCNCIQDIVITGETDLKHGQAWHHYHLLGRVRLWDGLVAFLRIPKDFHAGLLTQLFYGYFESDTNFVGSWRMVVGDRAEQNFVVPPVFDSQGGLSGSGLIGQGGAGVLGDGMRVLLEGPFSMTRVVED